MVYNCHPPSAGGLVNETLDKIVSLRQTAEGLSVIKATLEEMTAFARCNRAENVLLTAAQTSAVKDVLSPLCNLLRFVMTQCVVVVF